MTELEKCHAGLPYDGNDKEIRAKGARCKRLLAELRAIPYDDEASKERIRRELFGRIGEKVFIEDDFRCIFGENIRFGERVIVNLNCTFLDDGIIEIGDNVMIAPDVKIYTATHSLQLSERMPKEMPCGGACMTIARKVTIEDGVWIGGGSIILPGITIGQNAVIGAGSVVTKDVPANTVAAGNPARAIKRIP